LQDQAAKSTYAGEYTGPFVFTGAIPGFKDDKGTYTISIAANGKLAGKTKSDLNGLTTDVKGSISSEGRVEITVEFPWETYTMKGTVTKTSEGHLKGTLVQSDGKQIVGSDEIDLRPK
jgi:hypothetical protein